MYRPQLDYLPAEWERQDAVLLTWPRRDGDWAELWTEATQAFLKLAIAIARCQPLLLICPDPDEVRNIQAQLSAAGIQPSRWHCCAVPADDTWSRDFGPIGCLRNGHPHLLNFRFNAWGGRYPSQRDDAINTALEQQGVFSAPLQTCDFILEGGSIESDGKGTLLTTDRCLLSKQRNSGDRDLIEAQLKQHLPVERILWLKSGHLAGDDTDSHIDNLARFADADTILYAQYRESADEHHVALKAMEQELAAFSSSTGRPYRSKPLFLPAPIYSKVDGRRLPASYLNFLILNDAVLVPVFNDPADAAALDVIAGCFPGRRIVGIDSRTFIEQNGGVHCLTMQLMAGSVNPDFFKAAA